ncbi:MAG: hypothetical protein RL071_4739 [Pseudomonadota bacterium]
MYGRTGKLEGERRVDGLTRDEVCRRYKGRIALIARRIGERLPPDCELLTEDLAGFGAVGLLEAFDRFDEGRAIQFSTFAEYRIRGAMMDALRQNDAFSRYRRQMSRRIEDAQAGLLVEHGRAGTVDELCQRLGVDMETYWHMRACTQSVSYVSIFDGEDDDGEGEEGRSLSEVLSASSGDEPLRGLMGEDARALLKAALKELPERKRQCVILYYGRGLNLSEIARVFDVTPSRISQILSSAREELREILFDQIDLDDLAYGRINAEAL